MNAKGAARAGLPGCNMLACELPVLLSVNVASAVLPCATVPKSQEAMKAAGKAYDPVTYEGAGHGFMRAGEDPGNTNPANKKAHDEAWARWLGLLKKI